jgi:hypothetical protein
MGSLAHALKLFLPSWNFFDDFSVTARIEIRRRTGAGEAGGWRLLFPETSARGVGRVFFNARGNAELFKLAVVENVAERLKGVEAVQRGEFESSEDGVRLAAWVCEEAARSGASGEAQYRLRLTTCLGDVEEWFVSQWLLVS